MAWIRETVTPFALGEWAFELRDDEVSRIRYRGIDVLRSVRAVARDRDWATPQWALGDVREVPGGIRMSLRTTQLGADLYASLAATADGERLTVALEATSAVEFDTNRTGLIVLHPPGLAGAPLAVGHEDGTRTDTAFPREISPHQPAFDIRELGWEHGGLAVRCVFDGDVFEMEDQRNWSDASFKTYSRPLALPFPYRIGAGETVRQAVTVTVSGAPADAPAMSPSAARERNDPSLAEALGFGPTAPFPAVSVGASTAPGVGPRAEPIGSDVLVELDLGWTGWPAALRRAAASGLPLDVRFVLPETCTGAADAGLRGALRAAAGALRGLDVARVTAFRPAGHEAQHVSDTAAISALREALAGAGIDAPVIGGVRSHFTELNREHHRLPEGLAGIAFSTTPTFHSSETLQVEQAVAMQRLAAQQAVRIAGGAPVHIGPITLRTHVNNVATTAPPRPSSDDLGEGYGPELLDADDERQSAPELAAWTIASAAALGVPGVATLSFFEEWGPRGVRTATGDELPAAEAVRVLAGFGGLPASTAHSVDGLVWAIRTNEGALLASLDDAPRTLAVGAQRLTVPPRGWLRTA
ncbi:hypothetical protein [Microbacterium halophytorum]|uniref:hypothetical protein n=1 Tax=Microbacterium halophytorum TaxID=2067568 RepID=UPI000CFCB49F|nr:hypothetical protein [Microbacterium halophytorum]